MCIQVTHNSLDVFIHLLGHALIPGPFLFELTYQSIYVLCTYGLLSILVASSLNSQTKLVDVQLFLLFSVWRVQYLFCVSLPIDNFQPALLGVISFNHLLLRYLTRIWYVPGTMGVSHVMVTVNKERSQSACVLVEHIASNFKRMILQMGKSRAQGSVQLSWI